jgi:hypothetical protein
MGKLTKDMTQTEIDNQRERASKNYYLRKGTKPKKKQDYDEILLGLTKEIKNINNPQIKLGILYSIKFIKEKLNI